MKEFDGYEIEDYQEEIKDLSLQVADSLSAALYFAGVKKAKLEEALDAYLDEMDKVMEDDDADFGCDEIVKIIKQLKLDRKDLFV
jgi:hypothetical protein